MPTEKKAFPRGSTGRLTSAVVANVLIAAVLVVAAVLSSADSELYYRSAQENGVLSGPTERGDTSSGEILGDDIGIVDLEQSTWIES